MLPVLPILAIGAAFLGGKKIYDAVTGNSGGSSSSATSDNSYERAQEAHQAEKRNSQEESEARQLKQLQQTLHTELCDLHKEYLNKYVTISVPSRSQIQRFVDCEIDQLGAAKEALGQLLGVSVQLKEQPNQIANNKKQLKELNELEQLVRDL